MGRGYIAIEGQGEVQAVHNLIVRLWSDLSLSYLHWHPRPIREPALHTSAGIAKVCRTVRSQGDASALLVIRDADDDKDCPKVRGPETARWLADERLPMPAAVVLIRREFETLFLPCVPRMAGKLLDGRPGLRADAAYGGDYEAKRGVKEWLSKHYEGGARYKPTLDQLPLTRLMDFNDLRRSGLPSFGTLERALRFLNNAAAGSVYPSDTPVG